VYAEICVNNIVVCSRLNSFAKRVPFSVTYQYLPKAEMTHFPSCHDFAELNDNIY